MILVGTGYSCIQLNQRRNSPSNKSGNIFFSHEIMYHFLRFLLMYIILPKDYDVIYLVSPILHCSSLLSNPCQKSSFIFKNLGLIIKTCTHYAQFFIKHYPIYIYISVLLLCDSALTILPLLRGENDVAQKPFVAYVVS